MSLLKKALREGNYELAALTIVYDMLRVIHLVKTSLTVMSNCWSAGISFLLSSRSSGTVHNAPPRS